jgi:hypothetical protein
MAPAASVKVGEISRRSLLNSKLNRQIQTTIKAHQMIWEIIEDKAMK